MNMTFEELKQQPAGVVFCEDDLPNMPLFQLMGPAAERTGDIIIREINPASDFDVGRYFGDPARDSRAADKRFYVFTQDDLDRLIVTLKAAEPRT
jgi:hypothetical protein